MICNKGRWAPLVIAALCVWGVHAQFNQECGAGDFRCDDGKCLESWRKCDHISDCTLGEDERGCACGSDEFQCASDGACIEARKRCDGLNHCRDGTDELDCACSSDQWQCDQGNCIPRNKRCNGRVDCPTDRSDERHCVAEGYFKCKAGKIIPESLRCNRRYDCPTGDYSDEKNCPCGDQDFKCNNGHCIPKSKRCDRTRDCQDGSDELYCSYGKECMAYELKCTNGQCVHAESRCNGTAECDDNSDERSCPCKRGQFRCRDGSCINIALRCNGHKNCARGEDETNCGNARCPADKFTCDSGPVQCATRCDAVSECANNEDEDGCSEDACSHECDGRCLEDVKICNSIADCSDGSDEQVCDNCDGPDDFRCDNNDCISANQRCNSIPECNDGSDELNCNETMIASNSGCSENQFKCRDGTCINAEFYCDGRIDCLDKSDELACSCNKDEFQCVSGQCIPSYLKCDGNPDCTDRSDENDPECYSPAGGLPDNTGYQYPVDKQFTTTARTNEDNPYVPGTGPNRDNRYPTYGESTERRPTSRPPYGGEEESNTDASVDDGSDTVTTTSSGSDARYNPYDSRPGYQPPPPVSTTSSPDTVYDPYNSRPGSFQPSTYAPRDNDPYPGRVPYNPVEPSTSAPSTVSPGDGQTVYDPYNQRPSSYRPPTSGSSNNVYDPYNQRPSSYRPPTSGSSNNVYDPYNPRPGPYQPPTSSSNDNVYDPYNPRPRSYQPPTSASGDNVYDPYNPRPGSYQPPTSASGNNGGRPGSDSQTGSGSVRGGSIACQRHEWRCENGPCIDARRRCDGRVDCPFDLSDEFDCPAGSPVTLLVTTYPKQQTVRYGGDVVFQCRDEGPLRAPVRWVREGGRALKPGARDIQGRLEINGVSAGDAGVYICQTPRYLGTPGSEVRVTLNVQNRVPQRGPDAKSTCGPNQATCGNGDCIDKSRVCDGKLDCADKSDEDMCTKTGQCEPNQFQCDNRKCVLKTWLCDSEDDCGDGSDERRCGPVPPGEPCLPSEFTCHDGNQCIPRSFHCDQRSDCFDKSDELGCADVYIVKSPTPANLRLNVNDTLVLRAEAKGNPVPVISWRLNWGHVPPQCTSTSENGVGVLTCPFMQPEHSGAYSAEALNNKGTTFANPDAIVFVTQTSPCPTGYFNDEAKSRDDCIKCFCFGESTTCRSADLFTYTMPTPLGQGGTRLQGVTITREGEIRTDTSIANHYYYQPLRNGATVTKLESFDGGSLGSFHPYLALPETYYGQQLTSYGGHIKYSLAPHSRSYNVDDSAPSIIIKGKYKSLFYFHRSRGISVNMPLEVRLTPENWLKPGSYEFEPATREDIMMTLDDIETIWLRADLNNGGVNITNFVMESAQSINVGLGAASLVEECTCPLGYKGLSCQKCATGYVRENSGPWLGSCVRESCPPGSYGDPSRDIPCNPCPCPLTNRENRFARTCSLAADGSVACDCFPGYNGNNCESCAPGYEGNPQIPGDSCRQIPAERCHSDGTESTRLLGECTCKENVQGRYCDQCKNNSFYLSNDFRQGCALCFCTGLSTQCMSSNLRRKTTSVNFNVPNLTDQVRVYSSNPGGALAAYGAPDLIPDLRPVLTSGGLRIRGYNGPESSVLYWSMPFSFTGDKVTSYGGYMKYVLDNVPSFISPRTRNNAADVILISVNHLTFQYFGDFRASPEGILNASVQFLETSKWRRSDGMEISREHFLLALADVKDILIKATYGDVIATPLVASIETAEPNGNGPAALHVEQCVCPTGYIGTSCEDCAPGYTRTLTGLYLENCIPCDCNGHSKQCHPDNGDCYNCLDNTDGPRCELCKPGYERDAYDNCVEVEGPSSTSSPCRCDPRGSTGSCDESGQCYCKANVEGSNCDRCRLGAFGLELKNPEGCISCFCSGVTQECQEANHFVRIAMAAPIFGDDNGGYTLTDLNSVNVYKDEFVPQPDRSELMYVFAFPPNEELYWSLPVFPGNRVTSYGGTLSLRQEFVSNNNDAVSERGTDVVLAGDTISVYWTNPNVLRSGQALSYQVPLTERGWYRVGTTTSATRSDFMRVLKSLRQVLVRATLTENIESTSIADVSMDIASENAQPGAMAALGVELCTCPPGHLGTSCESCAAGYYKNEQDFCQQCPCSGHDCQLHSDGQVTCNCRPPYTGRDCGAVAGESQGTTSRPFPGQSTVSVRIINQDVIRIEEIGNSVNFSCQASSRINNNPLPISWSKMGGYLPQDRVFIDENSGFLKIVNLQISDSGVYVCESNDGISTASQTVTLKVPANTMTLPIVTIKPAVADYYEGDHIVLECEAKGNPMPTISWRRTSQRPLPLTFATEGPLFIIESARREDSGEYSCRASNSAGSSENIAVINIRERPSRPPRDRLIVTPQAPVVYEGQTTRVVCTGSTSVPTGTIDWVRQDSQRFQPNVRSDNGVLYIETATLDNQGVYICQTQSADVAPVPILVTVNRVNTPPPGERSNISVPTENLRIAAGETGTIVCSPSGYPLPRVNWTKHQGNFGRGVSQRGDMLIINNAVESDAGYYVCKGHVEGQSRPVGIIYVNVEIDRREAPVVKILPEGEQPAAFNSTFEFHCRVLAGIPEPDIIWSRGGSRAFSRTTQIMPRNILRFERVDVNDEGEYVCTGSNLVGSSSSSAVLKVRAPPVINITPTNYVIVQYGEPLNMECRASGYPDPLVSIRGPDRRELAPPAPIIATIRVPSATERDDGDYTCLATSAAGTLEESFLVRVNRGDSFPDNGVEGSGDNGYNPVDPNYDPNYNPNYDPNANNERPSDLNFIEGKERSEVDCPLVPGGYEARWDRSDRQPLQRNAVQEGNKLVIYRASSADNGEYVCSLYNSESNYVQVARYIRIVVVRPPRITLRPQNQTVLPGQSPVVECIVDGDDIQSIQWRPLNRNPSRRIEIRDSTLIFHQIEVEDAGEYECFVKNRYANASATAKVIVADNREPRQLVEIDRLRTSFNTGENVQITCRALNRNVDVKWQKFNSNQFVESRRFGGGAILILNSVTPADEGTYQCEGTDLNGQKSYQNFDLRVEPGQLTNPSYTQDRDVPVTQYKARLGDSVEMPCNHDLEGPVSIKWQRLYLPLPTDVRSDQPILYLKNVTEGDAGTYICRVSNNRATVEARAIVRVTGVVPSFKGSSWAALPTIADAYRQFDIEVSFKPTDSNGLILYNSENPTRFAGDFLALELENYTPVFILEVGNGPIFVRGDRPLALNEWHTVRLNRIGSEISMNVDDIGPFTNSTAENWVLDLKQPLYVGGVPNENNLPQQLAGAPGFVGCISMLIIGREETNIMTNNIDRRNIDQCEICSPNLCQNSGVCQEARNERGYVCICPKGFAGRNCERQGEACHPGLCGPGKCQDTADGYKCACPVTHTGRNCEETQFVEYPAFSGSAYLALDAPDSGRFLKLSMKIKPTYPVQDGIVMYCAESKRGLGGFTSLAVRNQRLEFRYDLNDGYPIVLRSNNTLPARDWTDVQITRSGPMFSLTINAVQTYEQRRDSANKSLNIKTPMFVGGVDETITLNNNTGVSAGFSGCIKDVATQGNSVNIVTSHNYSGNVQDCNMIESRGDIPEENPCNCENGGVCNADRTCSCPPGTSGYYCEGRDLSRQTARRPAAGTTTDPCEVRPCRNGGTCTPNYSYANLMNHTCDCPLGYSGASCQIELRLHFGVSFNGDGYMELPASLVNYDSESNPATIAMAVITTQNGVLLYQTEMASALDEYGTGDFVLLRIDRGYVVLDWDMGSGTTSLTVDSKFVTDGDRHQIIVRFLHDSKVELTVDDQSATGFTNGIANSMNVDSNIYIGGIPERLNIHHYSGLVGCIEQTEFMNVNRPVVLGDVAVAARNTQRCRQPIG